MKRRSLLSSLASAASLTLAGCQQLGSNSGSSTPGEHSPTLSGTSTDRTNLRFTANPVSRGALTADTPLWVVDSRQQDLLLGDVSSYQSRIFQEIPAFEYTALGSAGGVFPHGELGPLTTGADGPAIELRSTTAARYRLWYTLTDSSPSDGEPLSTFPRPVQSLVRTLVSETEPGRENRIERMVAVPAGEMVRDRTVIVGDQPYTIHSPPVQTPDWPPAALSLSAWTTEQETTPRSCTASPPISDSQVSELCTDGLTLPASNELARELTDSRPVLLSLTSLWYVSEQSR
ncbi:hypothetical protein [Haloarchaeobius sp. HME9146]|uniref:hypothetical protein n=1 Tax=Haloarchaeobius sp. HME9146 TaxID=2978732 RepID=UPI0021BF1635|nr:hypothetical protein [Haloarchaeobius sp. HME9146]MCT9094609.1 hypothetical protein [Haloarchaeobius sp. HME9146]